MKYAKINGTHCYHYKHMYHITINDKPYYDTDNQHMAWIAYRAVCRKYESKPSKIVLQDNDAVLHTKDAGLMLLDDVDHVTTNDLLNIVMQQTNTDIKQLKQIVKDAGLPLSNSRVGNWTIPSDSRRYVQMHNDELAALLPYLLPMPKSQAVEVGYTPQNLKNMRQQVGLTQDQVADIVGVKGNRQVRRWEKAEQDMPNDKWQIFLEYYNKNTCNRS